MDKTHPIDWASVDPLGQALHFLRMDGTFYCHSELTAPWGVEMPVIPNSLMFHVVLSGRGLIRVDGNEWVELMAGDLALVPHGRGHDLADSPGSETPNILELEREHIGPRYERLEYGGTGESTRMVCGAVQFDHPAATELVRLLPALIHVRDWPPTEARWIRSTLALMGEEASSSRAGGETVMTRLADILVVQAIRAWIRSAPAAEAGWIRALQDPAIGRAIAAVHGDPGLDWSVESLARYAGMSRSGFAARFVELVGDSPARYVTRWRMQLASTWLRHSKSSIAEISDQLGYSSQASFSRAFKRWSGVAPIALRRAAVA